MLSQSQRLENLLDQFRDEYKSNFDNAILETPPSEMWRYFVDYPANKGLSDGDMINIGWLSFTENNYLIGLTKAFHSMLTTSLNFNSATPPNDFVELMLKFQMRALFNVLDKRKIGICRYPDMRFGLHDKINTTRAGFNEIISEIKRDNTRLIQLDFYEQHAGKLVPVVRQYVTNSSNMRQAEAFLNPTNSHRINFKDVNDYNQDKIDAIYRSYMEEHFLCGCDLVSLILSDDPEEIVEIKKKRLEQEFEIYQRNIANAQSMTDRLIAIGSLTSQIVKFHPFSDGNARTIAVLCLNFLLKQNGFPPAIVNPNFSGGYSGDEWQEEILNGMERALELAKKHTLPCIATEVILENATKEKQEQHQDAIQVETLVRNIRSLYAMISNYSIMKIIIEGLEQFVYNEKLTDTDIQSMSRICNKLLEVKESDSVKIPEIFTQEIQILSPATSGNLFSETADAKLKSLYANLIEAIKKPAPSVDKNLSLGSE